ncbi:ML5 [Symbiodinium sp. CCMP2592]|nr:ML5 [Symbiodinium sp. CCMP2592]
MADRKKARQAVRERLRANHQGTLQGRPQGRKDSAASSVQPLTKDEAELAKLRQVRGELEAQGALKKLSDDELVALDTAPRPEDEKLAVQLLTRTPEGSETTPAVPAALGYQAASLPPGVAAGLVPMLTTEAPHTPSGAYSVVPWQLQVQNAMAAPPAQYSDILKEVTGTKGPQVPVAPISLSYESVLSQTVGPAALDLDAQCSITEFGREIAEARNMYSNQVTQVELPPGRPDYGRQIAKLELPPGNVWGWQAQMQAKQRLDAAMQTNVNIREALQRNVQRMQRAMPRAHGEEPEASEAPRPDSSGSPRRHYHKVKLEIEVVKASSIPDATYFASCDPYVVVSIVDGDPLQDPRALSGYQEWRALHEQWSGQTKVIEGTRDPQFRARFRAEVRNREKTHIHFRLLDQDSISHADRDIGQAAVPLRDILDDSWAAVRGLALRPMDRKNSQAWAAIHKTRLHVAINFEGILGKVKTEDAMQRAVAVASTFTKSGRAGRSPRRQREGGGLLDMFGTDT